MNNEHCIPIPTASSLAFSNRPNSPNSPISPVSPISPSSPNALNSDDMLFHVNPEFPPRIDPKDLGQALFNRRRKSKKMLNEFFLYRKEFVRELKRLNLRPKQTRVSSLASTSWHKQPPSVKDEYRRLARETERYFMAERQREANNANECSRTPSNESSSPDDTTIELPFLTPPPENYQIDNQPSQPTNYFTPIQVAYPLNTSNYFWPQYYYDVSNMSMQIPQTLVQETSPYAYYRQQL